MNKKELNRNANKLDVIISNQCKLSNEHKSINDKLSAINNNNAFIAIFENKGKLRYKFIINFIVTAIIMLCLFYTGFYFWLYKDMNGVDKTFEIFGNGLFWIIAVIVYWEVSKIVNDLYVRSENNGKITRKKTTFI